MMKKWMTCVLAILVMSVWFVSPGVQQAQAAFPDKPISFIVPFGAGGGTDGMARALASRLEKELGVPVAVKNERGSGGRKGTFSLFKSKPDGYTIGFAHFATLLFDEAIRKKKNPIDYWKFAAILKVDHALFFINVNKKSPFKSINDFKTAGRPIKFGATGVGSPSWLFPKALGKEVGFPVSFVSGQKNLAAAALSVARGDVDASTGTFTHIRGVMEDLRPLVYIAEKRSHKLPDVPTIKEAGYDKLASLDVPWVVVAPPGTPEDRLEIIRAALRKVSTRKEYLDWAIDTGYSPVTVEPADFWKSFRARKALYESLNIKLKKK
ncbi:MAG: tripartite tricarboxylate transporter substrate binding protein [Deltaproteobacteria bacterium]|nr:tripartite tricarboxylate transporter substrate binding protein [Deltaproteobacteria bacterium]